MLPPRDCSLRRTHSMPRYSLRMAAEVRRLPSIGHSRPLAASICATGSEGPWPAGACRVSARCGAAAGSAALLAGHPTITFSHPAFIHARGLRPRGQDRYVCRPRRARVSPGSSGGAVWGHPSSLYCRLLPVPLRLRRTSASVPSASSDSVAGSGTWATRNPTRCDTYAGA